MLLNAVIFFTIPFIFSVVNGAEHGETCRTYNGLEGRCINLSDCKELFDMIKASGPQVNHQQAIGILQKSTCGYIQSEPLVCCALSENENAFIDSISSQQSPQTKPAYSPFIDGNNVNLPTTPLPARTTTNQPNGNTRPQSGFKTEKMVLPPSSPITQNNANKITKQPLDSNHKSGFTNIPTTTTTKATPKLTTIEVPTKASIIPKQTKPTTQATTVATTKIVVKPVVTAPPTIATTTTAPIINPVQSKLLPEDCGRVLSFKHFIGNQTEFDDFPWVTILVYNTPNGIKSACGGTLISKRYVLTSAHCITDLYEKWNLTSVRFGEYNTATEVDCMSDGNNDNFCNAPPIDVPVEESIVHPGYNVFDPSRSHDIALIRLARDIPFTYNVQPICLPFRKPEPQRFYTSGWGHSWNRNGTNIKYMSYLTRVDNYICAKKYLSKNVYLDQTKLCAGLKPSEKPCVGDSGTSLMGIEERAKQIKRVAIFGVLSIIHPSDGSCEQSDWPGIYANVIEYVPWILSRLRQ